MVYVMFAHVKVAAILTITIMDAIMLRKMCELYEYEVLTIWKLIEVIAYFVGQYGGNHLMVIHV